jgi:pantoate--beta-alanine ligase
VKVLKSPEAARAVRMGARGRVVLVPTMGALHKAHAALFRRARRLAGNKGTVIVSLFVNPLQFGPMEDFTGYPRSPLRDLEICRACGVDLVFAPTSRQMYRADRSVFVDEISLSRHLCGASRPGHFRGVCTVVAKLFLILLPEVAIFGEKDWQQLCIIRKMVRDLSFPIGIVGQATIREPDGLATSSRNQYLEPGERAVAPGIYAALRAAVNRRRVHDIVRTGRRLIEEIPGAKLDYLELVDAENLETANNLRRPARLAAAVFLGKARLIDNVALPPRT